MTTDAADVGELEDSRVYSVKKRVDDLLVVVLLVIPLYLYLELLASSANPLYAFKPHLQYLLLAYFVSEILLSFFLYETYREFLRDRWVDILLTIPFLKAAKTGKALVGGMKALRVGKAVKLGKGTKVVLAKGTKFTQKASKFVLKGRKVRKKGDQDRPTDGQCPDSDES
ncbi:hypothetical protein [Natrialbaceae archaeon AArc-T1-2]|uniref:hypothetical protein n=1 Tax=Natrialbaceae archaeon AArc-T1-2 TaxID=3053904 RepID=UPI00255AE6E0|nr:hypothetical protein [Natrialbaceae archaeon AArc-T1-2]WIV68798.1 hypothetical protein QQ977_15930 [Natrialbaceae archaeon AArc-T1-2]